MQIISLLIIKVTLILLYLNVNLIDCNCIWYGECGPSAAGNGLKYNCEYKGEAKQLLDKDSLAIIKDLCPHLYQGDNQTYTCCDPAQIHRFNEDLSLPKQLLLRCPACYRNFRTFLCDMTCNPNQAQFLNITKDQPCTNKTKEIEREEVTQEENEDYDDDDSLIKKRSTDDDQCMEITQLNYEITPFFVERFYNSCKDVKFSSSNGKVLDLLCGTTACTPEKLVYFLGNNPQSPFVFNVILTNDSNAANSTSFDCNTSINEKYYKAGACGCSDCALSCPMPPPYIPKEECRIWSIRCFTFTVACCYIAFVVSFFGILLFSYLRNSHKKNENFSEGMLRALIFKALN